MNKIPPTIPTKLQAVHVILLAVTPCELVRTYQRLAETQSPSLGLKSYDLLGVRI
jgi:hypothetical protein